MKFQKEAILTFAKELLSIDSPSGYTHHASAFVKDKATALGYTTSYNQKGNLMIHVPGKSHEKTIGLSAHIDTLGLMVRSIHTDGTLFVTNIGSPTLPTLDSEYCRIITRDEKIYTGTIICEAASKHVHEDASSAKRDLHTLQVRIDEVVKNKEDVLALGINNGDFIAIEPKVDITPSGFIKSRFLDDKISVAALYGYLLYLHQNHLQPAYDIIMIISTYEEVGHGAACISPQINEMISVDMGCIGLDLACSEYDVSICAKDSSGPYDFHMTNRLISLAKQEKLSYAVDIYPMYGSDVSSALKGGNDIKGALIGPGVHASHGMERTHYQALEQTMKLIAAYCE